MSAHQPIWVRDRFKCKCLSNEHFQVSCDAIDETLKTAPRPNTDRIIPGKAFKVSLPLSRVLLVEFEVIPHEMSTFSGDNNDKRIVLSMKVKGHPDFEHWLGVNENYFPAVQSFRDYFSAQMEFGEAEHLITTRNRRLPCSGRHHVPEDDSRHRLLARQFGLKEVVYALAFTLRDSGRCFSCWDAVRMMNSGAVVPQV